MKKIVTSTGVYGPFYSVVERLDGYLCSVPQGMYWRDLTKTARSMTYSDLQALANAILARSLIEDTNLMNKLQAVDQAETIEAVLAIEW